MPLYACRYRITLERSKFSAEPQACDKRRQWRSGSGRTLAEQRQALQLLIAFSCESSAQSD